MNPGYCVSQGGADEGGRPAGGSALAFQGRSCKQRGIRLAIATYLCCCVTQVRALRRAAAKAPLPRRGARDPRGVGETREGGTLSGLTTLCMVRGEGEGIPRPYSHFTGPSRGLSDSVLRKP